MNERPLVGIYITEFHSTKDKNIKPSSISELIREGNISNFVVVGKIDENSEEEYITDRISKLDLYHDEIITQDKRRYKIMNDYEVSKIK